MLRLRLLLCLLCVVVFVSAQSPLSKDFVVTTSQPYGVVDAQNKEYFTDNKGFAYSIKTNEENVIVQKFDVQGMKEVARNEYKDTHPYNKAVGYIEIDNHYYCLFDSYDKSKDIRQVFLREFLTENCSLSSQKLILTSGGDVANGPATENVGYWTVKGGPAFTVYKSLDNSKIMIQYRRKPLVKDDELNSDLMGFYVYNTSFELIWGREVKMPYTEKEMNNLSYMVGNDGTAYMMMFYKGEQDFRLLTILPEGEPEVTIVQKGEFMFKRLYMTENKAGNIDFLGYYANGLDFKFWEGSWGKLSFNINGIKYFELSKQGKLLKSKDVEFPLELINKYESDRDKEKNDKREEVGNAGIRDLVLRQFTVYPDGSVFILGEQCYYTQSFNSNTYQMVYTFYYDDMVATKLNANGEVLWMTKLPKRQTGSKGKGGMGIAYFEANNSHYILYLDNIKNANIDVNQVPARHVDGMGGFLTAYIIDDVTGEYSKHPLYNSIEVNGVKTYQFQTTRLLEVMDNVLFVEVYLKDKKDMFIKMELAH